MCDAPEAKASLNTSARIGCVRCVCASVPRCMQRKIWPTLADTPPFPACPNPKFSHIDAPCRSSSTVTAGGRLVSKKILGLDGKFYTTCTPSCPVSHGYAAGKIRLLASITSCPLQRLQEADDSSTEAEECEAMPVRS